MKIEPTFPENHIHPQQVRRRLEVLLAAWASPTSLHGEHAWESPFVTPEEAAAWEGFITEARIVPPVSTKEGLDAALASHNAVMSDDELWTMRIVEERGIARVIGPRASVRSAVDIRGPTLSDGRHWTLAMPCDEEEFERLQQTFIRVFANVQFVNGELRASELRVVVPVSASILGCLAFGITDGTPLFAIWQKAEALGITRLWIETLDKRQRVALSDYLLDQLNEAAAYLTWRIDLELDGNRWSLDVGTPTFPCRLDELFWAKHIREHTRDGFAPAFFFGAMTSAVVLAGHEVHIGRLLSMLPPGRAYFAAVDTLRRHRPQAVAYLLWHPAFALEGMFAMADWPDTRDVSRDVRIHMKDEWIEAMRCSRRLALFPERNPDLAAATALCVYDEAREAAAAYNPYVRVPTPPAAVRFAPWPDRLVADADAEAIVAVIEARFGYDIIESDFVVALRFLELLASPHPLRATRLATIIVNAYAARLTLDPRYGGGAPLLDVHGDLLTVLDRVLRMNSQGVWKHWLTPFDVAMLVERSNEGLPDVIEGGDVVPMFDAPRCVFVHASNLIAAAGTAISEDVAEPLEAFVVLFERTCAKMAFDPWGSTLSRDITRPMPSFRTLLAAMHAAALGDTSAVQMHQQNLCERMQRDPRGSAPLRDAVQPMPILARFSHVLAKLPERVAGTLVDRLIDGGATELHLADMLWGLGPKSPLVPRIADRAHRRATALLQIGVSLGDASSLAIACYHAQMPDLAEAYARHLLTETSKQPTHLVQQLRDTGVQVLLASWVAQEKWSDVEGTDLGISDWRGMALIENLRAKAEIERGKVDNALARIDRLLERAPTNAMALSQRAEAFAVKRDWAACLRALEAARTALADDAPHQLHEIEAIACYHSGDPVRAAQALDKLPAELVRTPNIMRLRVALAMTTAPAFGRLKEDLRVLARTDPAFADFWQARLAPLTAIELGAGWVAPGEREMRSFEERCAGVREDPTDLLVRNLVGAAQRIAETPSLARALDEDQLTQMLCMLLVPLEALKVYAHVLEPAGWGEKKTGVADFALYNISTIPTVPSRRLVLGEAKIWDGPKWMREGLCQIFGTGNTGAELFLVLVIYCRTKQFQDTIDSIRNALATFGANEQGAFSVVREPEEVPIGSGEAVRIFHSEHRKDPACTSQRLRTLYTIAVDILSEPARRVRHGNASAGK